MTEDQYTNRQIALERTQRMQRLTRGVFCFHVILVLAGFVSAFLHGNPWFTALAIGPNTVLAGVAVYNYRFWAKREVFWRERMSSDVYS